MVLDPAHSGGFTSAGTAGNDNFDKLFILLERHLKEFYGSGNRTDEEEILLTFVIGGTLHTLRSLKFERNCDDAVLAERMSEILAKVNELHTPHK